MSPERARVINRMVNTYYKLSQLSYSVVTNEFAHYKTKSLREYLESIGLKGDELAYGLGLQR